MDYIFLNMLTQKAINITLDRHNFKVHMHDEPFHVSMNLHTRAGFRKIDSGLKGLYGFCLNVISGRMKPEKSREKPNKATFETTLWHQNNYPWSSAENEYYTISNMPPKNMIQEQDGWWKTEFEKTVKMSTYLKAFAIVDFGSVHHKSPITKTDHELFARTELIGEKDQADTDIDTTNVMWFPMECTGRTTDMLGHMLGVDYPGMGVDKADQIALPDFDAGAMENWGLVTYREQSLLFDMNRDRFSRKSYVCTTVSHEMAHMWFGDYVTCQWWDELWLNEAFATYFAWVGVEPSEKDSLQWKDETGVATWDLDHDLITGRMTAALNADQTVSSNPIINIENRIGFNLVWI